MKKFLIILLFALTTSCVKYTYTIKYVYENMPKDTLEYSSTIKGRKTDDLEAKTFSVSTEKHTTKYRICVESFWEIQTIYQGISPIKVTEFEQNTAF